MANQQSYVYLFLVFFSAFAFTSHAYHQLTVGGKDGWVLNPSESYNHWAERMRFQVNDTLFFKYKKGSDSVLVVNKDDYDKCNTGNPILKLEDGNSVFKFNRSGPVFFISGNKSNCVNGQKLIIVVLAVRNHNSPPPPLPKDPSPAAPPKGSSHAPAPQGEAPASASSPPLSPSPPAEAPAPATGNGPSENSAPGSGVIDTAGSPPRRSFATPACIPSVVLVSTVSLVLSVCLGGFIISL